MYYQSNGIPATQNKFNLVLKMWIETQKENIGVNIKTQKKASSDNDRHNLCGFGL